jgi:acetyl-CoA carboxylase biotin carboxylase subunit
MALDRVLIANRGEIAVRILRACHDRGIETVLAVSEADRTSLAARTAGRTVCVGPARATDSYLNAPALVTARGQALLVAAGAWLLVGTLGTLLAPLAVGQPLGDPLAILIGAGAAGILIAIRSVAATRRLAAEAGGV